jgi:serine/threonine protein phosphatase PrpC
VNLLIDITYLGSKNEQKGKFKIIKHEFGPVTSISIGKVKKTNEDSIRIGKSEIGYYFALVDGHWGYNCAEYIIKYVVDDFKSYLGELSNLIHFQNKNNIEEKLKKVLLNHNKIITNQTNSESTFIFVFVIENCLIWLSLGDSYLFIKTKDNKYCINNQIPFWLGSRLSEKDLVKYCEINIIENWEQFSIMSDGIPECKYNEITISKEEILKIMNFANSKTISQTLINNAFDKGGEDNIALIVVQKSDLP